MDLDIPSLLEPLEGESRGGVDLRDDEDPNNAYRRIRDARNDAREEERQSDLSGEMRSAPPSEWSTVWEEGVEYLGSVAKDLEIVAYMIEASVRLGGFSGLTASLNLTRQLIEEFWGELLPTPDEDGIETTIRPIARLNGDVITYPIMRIPITADTSAGEFVVWQYAQARQLQTLAAEEQQERISRGATTVETLNQAVAETIATDPAFYQRLYSSLKEAESSVTALSEAFESRVDDELQPNFSKFTGSVEETESTLRQLAGDYLEPADESVSDEDGEGGGDAESAGSGGGGGAARSGGIGSREDAFQMLEKIAQWFEKNEPQSVLPTEIRQSIRRGRMTPMELYMDLIRDDDVRRQLFRDVGIQVAEEEY